MKLNHIIRIITIPLYLISFLLYLIVMPVGFLLGRIIPATKIGEKIFIIIFYVPMFLMFYVWAIPSYIDEYFGLSPLFHPPISIM